MARPRKPKKAACTRTAEVQAAFCPRLTLIGYNKPRPALHLGRIPYIVKTGAIMKFLKL
ncbi:MAG: phosphoglycerate kinase, partial [Kingella sp. (in: b-proteobacteria)]